MIVHEKYSKPKDLFYVGKKSYLSRESLEYAKEELYADELWYWYEDAGYEGWGYALIRVGDLYDLHDLSHCSCYDGWDDINFKGLPLEDLWTGLVEDLKRCTQDLFVAAGLSI